MTTERDRLLHRELIERVIRSDPKLNDRQVAAVVADKVGSGISHVTVSTVRMRVQLAESESSPVARAAELLAKPEPDTPFQALKRRRAERIERQRRGPPRPERSYAEWLRLYEAGDLDHHDWTTYEPKREDR